MTMIAVGDEHDNDFSYAYHKGIKNGRKEVVKWLDNHCIYIHIVKTNGTEETVIQVLTSNPDWQVKLKEWGLAEVCNLCGQSNNGNHESCENYENRPLPDKE